MVNMSDVWHALPPDTYPITGICIVADKSKCPPGYNVVDKTVDTGEDADIWKDSFFSRRVTRYFCVTRIFPQDYGRLNNVLTNVVIVNSAEELPEGFTQVEWTHDSREKATRKRVCGVKMAPRENSDEAVCEIALTSRNKRAPPVGFSFVGDMDGLNFSFKMAPVPSHTKKSGASSSGVSTSTPPPRPAPPTPIQPPSNLATPQPRYNRQPSVAETSSFLDGVTFVLNSKFAPNNATSTFDYPQPKFKTGEEIDAEFSYSFISEYQLMES